MIVYRNVKNRYSHAFTSYKILCYYILESRMDRYDGKEKNYENLEKHKIYRKKHFNKSSKFKRDII
jgi:hypothetical protein